MGIWISWGHSMRCGIRVRSNRYVEESAPWKLAKDPVNARQLDGVLYIWRIHSLIPFW